MDAKVGKYPAAEVAFLTAAANGTANYGGDLFGTKAAMLGVADPVPMDSLLM